MTGLTESGFIKKTLDQIKADMEEAIIAVFGQANVAPDSTFGQIIGIMSEVVSDVWDLAELVYNSQYPNSALGVSLDNVAELNNLKRLDATRSSAVCILEGDASTLVPAGTQLRQTSFNELFQTTVDVTISQLVIQRAVVSVNTESDNPYTININSPLGTDGYTSNETVTLDILEDLRDQMNAGTIVKATVDTDAETLTITTYDDETAFEIGLGTTNLDLDELWSPVTVEAVNPGKKSVPANSINAVETPVSGLNSSDNLLAGTEGRDVETDDEFRLRRVQSLRVIGAATVPAIEARILQEVDGVTAVTVKDNRTDGTVEGRPPHSFESIVTYPEGDAVIEQAIADKIWEVGGAGIQTHGDISKTVIDSSGDSHIVKFSRPEDRYVHINIEISLYDEEIFPTDGEDAIKQALEDYGNTLRVGEDVIRQRFYGAIYSVSGVEDILLYEHDDTTNPGDAPTYTTNNLVMASNQIARFNVDRIFVTIP
jgi:uncharacterized phage protein gp47/JayE